jgi:putative peptidoglycan lipid II flippase
LSFQFGIQRTFYALGDTRTPFLYTTVQAVLVIITAVVAFAVLPLPWLAVGIALGQSLANIFQFALAIVLLRRKIARPLGLGVAAGAVVRFVVAAVPATAGGWLTFQLLGGVGGWAASDRVTGFLSAALIGVVTLVIYVALLLILRAPELQTAVRAVRRFLPGR